MGKQVWLPSKGLRNAVSLGSMIVRNAASGCCQRDSGERPRRAGMRCCVVRPSAQRRAAPRAAGGRRQRMPQRDAGRAAGRRRAGRTARLPRALPRPPGPGCGRDAPVVAAGLGIYPTLP